MTQPESSLVSNLGLEDVPSGLPDGVYSGFLYDVKAVAHKDQTKGTSLVFTYKVDQPGTQEHNETHDEWKSANPGDDNQKKRFLKQRLDTLGVPESRMASVKASDLVGTPVFFTVKTNGAYKNISKVELRAPANQAAVQQFEQTQAGSTTTVTGGPGFEV